MSCCTMPMHAAKMAVAASDDRYDTECIGAAVEDRVRAGDHIRCPR